jgi:hypothetical protein
VLRISPWHPPFPHQLKIQLVWSFVFREAEQRFLLLFLEKEEYNPIEERLEKLKQANEHLVEKTRL